jgi:uncharacterized membrane protein YqhA
MAKDKGGGGNGLHDRLLTLGHVLGRSRLVVLVAVAAVLLAALTLFMVGAIEAVESVWSTWRTVLGGEAEPASVAVEFLGVVTTLLKAVVFYLIGVGLYSLFIAPLNLSISLGVETLTDLEARVVSIVIVILAVTFLEHFIRWEEPLETLQYAGSAALMIVALVLFQSYGRREKESQREHAVETRSRAQHEVFEEDRESHEVDREERARQDQQGNDDPAEERDASVS